MISKRSAVYLKRIGLSLALVGFGILIALIVIEIGLRLIPRAQLDAIVERSSQRLNLYQLNPNVGWSLNPSGQTVIIARDDRSIPIRINSLGLRDTEHSYEKPTDTFRILLLGDSFTEALDVRFEESYAYLLEQCLSERLDESIEVINAGVSGYGIGEEYLYYLTEGVRYEPDMVVLMLYMGNDFSDLFRSERDRLVAGFGGYRFELENGDLERIWVSWAYPLDERVSSPELFLRRYSILWRILAHPESKVYWTYRNLWNADNPGETNNRADKVNQRLDWRYFLHTKNFAENSAAPQPVRKAWRLFEALFEALRREVTNNNQQLVAVIIPADYQVNVEARQQLLEKLVLPALASQPIGIDWVDDEPNRSLVQLTAGKGVPVLDLHPYLKAHDEAGGASLYFQGFENHLNRDGQRLTANVLCDWLLQNESVRLKGE
jgi:hypothetical protein